MPHLHLPVLQQHLVLADGNAFRDRGEVDVLRVLNMAGRRAPCVAVAYAGERGVGATIVEMADGELALGVLERLKPQHHRVVESDRLVAVNGKDDVQQVLVLIERKQ